MKILYLITGLGGGGAEKVVCDLADNMVKNGHKVKIAYLTGSVVVRPEGNSIELICLNLNNISSFYSAFKSYRKILSVFKPDVVHAHMVHANIFARLSRIFVKVPRLICTAHSNNEGGRMRMLAYRLTHNLANVTTNVSKAASENFKKLGAIPKNDILTIYNGIDLDRFNKENHNVTTLKLDLSIPDSAMVFLAVGRFHEAKDYPNLLYSFALYLKKQSNSNNFKLLIVGDGDSELKNLIQKLILKLKLENNVQLLGRREDIPTLLSMANFFVLSSSYEGFGLVIAEAMGCGTFVIATDCGGSAEIMGDTGILVPPQNSKALAEALNIAIEKKPNEIAENNFKARQRVEKLFSLEKSVQKWLELYTND